MDYASPWPGYDEAPPVVINARRPGRNRPRLATDHAVPRQAQMFYFQDGQQLLVPGPGLGPGLHHRSSSASGGRPAQVIINNDNLAAWDNHSSRRPRSVHYDDYYYDPHDRERSRSRPRHRSRTPSPYHEDIETKGKLKRLEELEQKEEEERREKRLKEKLVLEKAKREAEEAEREKEANELKKRAIEEYKAKEEKEKAKKKKEKEEADEEFQERMRKTLRASGYSDSQIDRILTKGEKPSQGAKEGTKVLALSRPTYIRVRRKHLDPETLDLYQLPWVWDETDDNFIIIKQWIPERDQEMLFEHTRKLRESKQLTYTTTELRKERDQLLLVKKKEPRKRSPSKNWLLT